MADDIKKEEKLEDAEVAEEVMKEEKKIEAEEIKEAEEGREEAPKTAVVAETKEIDRGKALKKWFKKPTEEKEEKKDWKPALAKKEPEKKKPVSSRNFRPALAYVMAVLVLAVSAGANVYLYKKYAAIENKLAANQRASQEAGKADKEKLDELAAKVEKLASVASAGGSVQGDATAAQTENKTGAIKVAIYNGTATVGLAKEMGATLKAKLAEAEVVALDNAKHSDYTKTLVMAIGGKVAEAQKIAQVIGAQFSMLPLDETKPDADVLVVVGK